MSTEIIRAGGEVVQVGALTPVLSIEQMVARHNAIVECAHKVLREGPDYGVMPNSRPGGKGEAAHKVLFKPGAEKLLSFFGLVPDFQEDKAVIDFDKGLFLFSYRCVLLRGATQEMNSVGRVVTVGNIVGTGIGSANSREKKYLRGARVCPVCGVAAIKRSKFPPREDPEATPGWYCHDKAGGCGMNYAADDERILESSNTVNPDEAADLVNTLQKMACKRALVAAVLVAVGASDLFTQDVIDDEPTAESKSSSQAPAKAKPATPQQVKEIESHFRRLRWVVGEVRAELANYLPNVQRHKLTAALLTEQQASELLHELVELTPSASDPVEAQERAGMKEG